MDRKSLTNHDLTSVVIALNGDQEGAPDRWHIFPNERKRVGFEPELHQSLQL